MDIKLDLADDQLKSLVSEAILKSLDDNKRNALVQGAIKHLLTEQKPSYGYGAPKSPIQDAFEYAIRNVAITVCKETLETDQSVRGKLAVLIQEAVTRLMDTNREKTVEKLADAIAAGMAYRERD